MKQGRLFDLGHPDTPAVTHTPSTAAADPDTSRHAERRHRASGAMSAHVRIVAELVRKHPSSTAVELFEAQTGTERLTRHEVSRRLPDAEKDGLVKRGPARLCRVAGTLQTTWESIIKEPADA